MNMKLNMQFSKYAGFLKSYVSYKGSVDPLRLVSKCQTPVQFLET